jgi:hypothetical protein
MAMLGRRYYDALPMRGDRGAGPKQRPEHTMNEDALNISIRKFLKMVGVSSQREIEQAVARALASGAVAGSASLPATMRLEIPGLRLDVRFDGQIQLE